MYVQRGKVFCEEREALFLVSNLENRLSEKQKKFCNDPSPSNAKRKFRGGRGKRERSLVSVPSETRTSPMRVKKKSAISNEKEGEALKGDQLLEKR